MHFPIGAFKFQRRHLRRNAAVQRPDAQQFGLWDDALRDPRKLRGVYRLNF
ncbi:MAG: hypothetical protein ABI835_14670 [Chloroflexota bacterium]